MRTAEEPSGESWRRGRSDRGRRVLVNFKSGYFHTFTPFHLVGRKPPTTNKSEQREYQLLLVRVGSLEATTRQRRPGPMAGLDSSRPSHCRASSPVRVAIAPRLESNCQLRAPKSLDSFVAVPVAPNRPPRLRHDAKPPVSTMACFTSALDWRATLDRGDPDWSINHARALASNRPPPPSDPKPATGAPSSGSWPASASTTLAHLFQAATAFHRRRAGRGSPAPPRPARTAPGAPRSRGPRARSRSPPRPPPASPPP